MILRRLLKKIRDFRKWFESEVDQSQWWDWMERVGKGRKIPRWRMKVSLISRPHFLLSQYLRYRVCVKLNKRIKEGMFEEAWKDLIESSLS